MSVTSLQLRSEITPAGQLRLSLEEREVAPPGPDEVVVRVEAAPINPADLAELLGSADVSTLRREATTDRPVTTAELPSRLVPLAAGRVGKSLAVGLEGAGVVVDAGANARHLLDKVVSAGAGRMYTQYRKLTASEVAPVPGRRDAGTGGVRICEPAHRSRHAVDNARGRALGVGSYRGCVEPRAD